LAAFGWRAAGAVNSKVGKTEERRGFDHGAILPELGSDAVSPTLGGIAILKLGYEVFSFRILQFSTVPTVQLANFGE
jgi:hypothetical protein